MNNICIKNTKMKKSQLRQVIKNVIKEQRKEFGQIPQIAVDKRKEDRWDDKPEMMCPSNGRKVRGINCANGQGIWFSCLVVNGGVPQPGQKVYWASMTGGMSNIQAELTSNITPGVVANQGVVYRNTLSPGPCYVPPIIHHYECDTDTGTFNGLGIWPVNGTPTAPSGGCCKTLIPGDVGYASASTTPCTNCELIHWQCDNYGSCFDFNVCNRTVGGAPMSPIDLELYNFFTQGCDGQCPVTGNVDLATCQAGCATQWECVPGTGCLGILPGGSPSNASNPLYGNPSTCMNHPSNHNGMTGNWGCNGPSIP